MPEVDLLGVVLLPLAAALLFAAATVFLKLTKSHSIDIWRVTFVSNLVTAIAFQPFWIWSEQAPHWDRLWQPAIVAALFIIGQVFTLLSLTKGDVSVAAPVLGLKLVFVPFFIWGLGAAQLPGTIWIACAVSAVAVVLLNYTSERSQRGLALYSAVTAMTGAAAYALFDVCVQMFSPVWEAAGFLPIVFVMSTAASLAFIPRFEAPLSKISGGGWAVLLAAATLFALQALAIVGSVSFWGQAAFANVVYSTRGLWSLLLVALCGQLFGITEAQLSRGVFLVRLAGALLMLTGIAILLVSTQTVS